MAQLVVWRGTIVGEENKQDFVDWFKEAGFEVEYKEEFKTLPDKDSVGQPVMNTGGRNDVLFTVSDAGIPKFALWRLQFNGEMSWWEDYLDNGGIDICPSSVLERYKEVA